jgi:CO dehydrogenase nickel-insertion accessory protein CooC1
LLRELEDEAGAVVVGDLEAGTGTMLRLQEGQADVALVVAQPTQKALAVARTAARIAGSRGARVVVVANRVRDDDDVALIRDALADHELVVVPDDPAIARADEDGVAPLDAAPEAPGTRAIVALAERLATV